MLKLNDNVAFRAAMKNYRFLMQGSPGRLLSLTTTDADTTSDWPQFHPAVKTNTFMLSGAPPAPEVFLEMSP
jgi:hypothetical protein